MDRRITPRRSRGRLMPGFRRVEKGRQFEEKDRRTVEIKADQSKNKLEGEEDVAVFKLPCAAQYSRRPGFSVRLTSRLSARSAWSEKAYLTRTSADKAIIHIRGDPVSNSFTEPSTDYLFHYVQRSVEQHMDRMSGII
jgi:hypothetical protein